MQSIEHTGEGDQRQDEVSNEPATKQTYVAAGAATLAVFGGLAGVLVGWIMGASPRIGGTPTLPGQGTLAGPDLLSTTLVAGLFGVGVGALVGALWGLNIPRADNGAGTGTPPQEEVHDHSERVVPLDYVPVSINSGVGPQPIAAARRSVSEDALMAPLQSATPYRDVDVLEEDLMLADQTTYIVESGEEAAMDDRSKDQAGQDSNNVTGTQGAIDPVTGAYGTAGTPVTTGYGVSGSTIGTGSSQVRDEHEVGDFAGSTPDSSSYEMGGRGSDDTPTASRPDDSSDTPVTEKYKGSMKSEAPAQSDPRTQDLYEAGPSYGPEVGQGKESTTNAETSHDSDASLDSPPSSKLVNSEEIDASAGTNIAGTSDPSGLGDNTDKT